MLTAEQLYRCYEWQTQRRKGGPKQANSNPWAVRRWVDWRKEWWLELEYWHAAIQMDEGAQRGEGDTTQHQERS